MIHADTPDPPRADSQIRRARSVDSIDPQHFSSPPAAATLPTYLADPCIRKLIDFFHRKGTGALKAEDGRETWYADWMHYQATHRIYASVLSSRQYSTLGGEFDLLRFTRLLEVFAYFSPAHAYSLQVTYLGLFSILMGSSDAMKREAVRTLEAGGVFAFGISERPHGSDLLANEFTLREAAPGEFLAGGEKYYIGNANVASMVSILARKQNGRAGGKSSRALPALFVWRPGKGLDGHEAQKIRTLGVRSAFVGTFKLTDHPVSRDDIVAEGRDAWDAVFGTITLGRFFLGFGSIGICEHALAEAVDHLTQRVLYRRPAIELPHIRIALARAYARLAAMKLYAYRALDYVHAATDSDRRYLLFTAVQKAKVSSDGVKVMSLISECVGAKGFEADTYIEMALRDIQLIPGLEGSTHLNLRAAAQFTERFLAGGGGGLPVIPSLVAGEATPRENPFVMRARTVAAGTVDFPDLLEAFSALKSIANVRRFMRQATEFRSFALQRSMRDAATADMQVTLHAGQCLAIIAYAQLIAEAASIVRTPAPLVCVMFDLLIGDLSAAAMALASLPQFGSADRAALRRVIKLPQTGAAEWESVAQRLLHTYVPPPP